MSVVVTSARTVSSGAVEVGFQDGHKLTFYPNQGGFGEPHEIERVTLSVKQEHVVVYNSPFQYVLNHKPFGFSLVRAGYTLERIVNYWQAAHDYLSEAHRNGKLQDAWFTVAKANKDLDAVRAGQWPCSK